MLTFGNSNYVTRDTQAALDEFNLADSLLISKIHYSSNVVKLAEKATLIIDTLSDKVKKCLFEAVVKDHIIYREEFLQAPYLISSTYETDTKEDYICKFLKRFPEEYRKIFKSLDSELFYNIINKPVWESDPYSEPSFSPFSVIQSVYWHKSRYSKSHDATKLYVEYEKEIDTDINFQRLGVQIKTNIFEHYLRNASSEEKSSWDFLAPLTPIFSTLKPLQQEIFVAVAISELFFERYYGQDDRLGNVKSDKYSSEEVMDSLTVVPFHLLNKHYQNENIDDQHIENLKALVLNAKLESTMPQKDEKNLRQ